MDNFTIDPSQIAGVLKQFDRKKEDAERVKTGTDSLKITSGLGTHTPTTLLADIRRCLVEHTEATRLNTEELSQMRQENAKHHQEQLAYLSQLSDAISRSQRPTLSLDNGLSGPSTPKGENYYYGDTILTSGHSIIGCILMQLDSLLVAVNVWKPDISDTTDMELKNWSSAVQMVSSANMGQHGALELPKPKSQSVQVALKVVASTMKGRNPPFTSTQLQALMSGCQSVMAVVDEVRKRLLLCPGLIGLSRHMRLSLVEYPFLDSSGDLRVLTIPSGSKINPDTCARVSKLKHTQRKAYVNSILTGSKKVSMALIAAEAAADVT